MGRGKVVLKRIEDNSSRHVTFSKRRKGLMKKARELSVLCDVDVAVVVFSGKGRLYEFCSGNNSLRKILERYQICIDAEDDAYKGAYEAKKHNAKYSTLRTSTDLLQMVQRQLEKPNVEQLSMIELMQLEQHLDGILRQIKFKKKDCTEYTGLRTSTHLLQMVQRHFEEQNVEHLNIKELMKLEQRLDAILRQTKIRKTELMMEAITALHEKEKQMMRANQIMEKKIAGMMNEENQHLPKNHPVVELGLDTHDANSFPPPKQAMLHLF